MKEEVNILESMKYMKYANTAYLIGLPRGEANQLFTLMPGTHAVLSSCQLLQLLK